MDVPEYEGFVDPNGRPVMATPLFCYLRRYIAAAANQLVAAFSRGVRRGVRRRC